MAAHSVGVEVFFDQLGVGEAQPGKRWGGEMDGPSTLNSIAEGSPISSNRSADRSLTLS